MEVNMQGNTLLLLARCLIQAYAIREASYVSAKLAKCKRTGERVISEGGYYTLSHGEALERAFEELTVGDEDRDNLRMPVNLMISWPNDSVEWANGIVEKYSDKTDRDAAQQEAALDLKAADATEDFVN